MATASMHAPPPAQGQSASLSRIGEGLSSCLQVAELQHATALRSLCLHGNNIARIEGLHHLRGLQDLNLSSNRIASVAGALGGLTSLCSLNLASNKLTGLHGLDALPSLTHLNLSYNALTSLDGLSALAGPQCKLRLLDVRHNLLPSLHAFAVLAGCLSLRELSIAGNPACAMPSHQQLLLQVLPHVARLDGRATADVLAAPVDAASAHQYAAQRLQAFDQQQGGPEAAPQQGGFGQPSTSGSARTPRVDANLASFYQRQHGSPPRSRDGGMGTGPPPFHTQQQQQQQHQQSRQAVNWQQHQGSGGARRARGASEGTMPPGGHETSFSDRGTKTGFDDDLHRETATRVRVYVMDAAVQTSSDVSVVTKLQAEADLLKEQLVKLTDELERRNVLEEQTHEELQSAVQAAQDEAHKRVEEGYREASQAVARALQELEAARLQGQQAQEQVQVHIKLEEEAKAQLAATQRELVRTQDDLRSVRDQAAADGRRASTSIEEERRRALDSEHALQQQVKTLREQLQAQGGELATARGAAVAAEQRAAALDAALQQTNAATVAMTGKIAQSVADANVQIDALKAKLASSEQQVADHQRREVEARAEINMLTAAMASLKTNHQQELDARERAAQEQLATSLDRERAAAEERGAASVRVAAERERGTAQEQLTFLKMQLQYALKESEREAAQLQDQVSQGQAEVQDLKAALHAAAAKNREHEGLVADLTQVLQQQKAHIQALQRDKEALAQQLRACAPERFDRLLAENQSLRRANAELDVLREQAAHHKRAWQEAERRLQESQASQSHNAEEAQAKAAAAEASLAQAREEAKAAALKAEGMVQQLAAAEDAVKVKRAMLDSANDTIEQLKAELADVQGELDDTRRMAEELDAQLRGGQEQDATEKANLRSEIEASEAALERMSTSVSEAQSKQRDAEARLKAAQDALAEREAMIGYINEEVDRVKGLFEQREGRLREERDAARHHADAAAAERDAAGARLRELEARGAQQLEALNKELEAARAEAHVAGEAAATARAEAAQLSRRLAETEDEMRQLLFAVEKQKAQSANKMKQLASFLQDM